MTNCRSFLGSEFLRVCPAISAFRPNFVRQTWRNSDLLEVFRTKPLIEGGGEEVNTLLKDIQGFKSAGDQTYVYNHNATEYLAESCSELTQKMSRLAELLEPSGEGTLRRLVMLGDVCSL